jgi:predicted nucleic acid-binding protein
MKVLFDTNIVLDVLLLRDTWLPEAQAVWDACDQDTIVGYISAVTLTTVFYFGRKKLGFERAREAILLCLNTFEICSVNRQTLELATTLIGADFEDNLQIVYASENGLDAIVSRDGSGFTASPVKVISPGQLLADLSG